MGQAKYYQVVFTWVIIEFGGDPSGRDLVRRMPISCEARCLFENPPFWKLDECIMVSGSVEI
jgi:hypothetical protein